MVRCNFADSVQQSLGRLTKSRQGIQSSKTKPHQFSSENDSLNVDIDFLECLDSKSFNKIYSKTRLLQHLTLSVLISLENSKLQVLAVTNIFDSLFGTTISITNQ